MVPGDLVPAFLDLAFSRGFAAGFALAAPIGPVAVLCIRRALTCGRTQAFIAGLGAAFADMIFGAIAGLGISAISGFVLDYEMIIGLFGGLIVVALGFVTYRTPVIVTEGRIQTKSLRRDFATAFTMAITNPATMIAAAGVFAAFAPVDMYTETARAVWLVTGVFAGSAAWWLILALFVGSHRARLIKTGLQWLNKISGSIILVSGVLILAVTIWKASQVFFA